LDDPFHDLPMFIFSTGVDEILVILSETRDLKTAVYRTGVDEILVIRKETRERKE